MNVNESNLYEIRALKQDCMLVVVMTVLAKHAVFGGQDETANEPDQN